MKHLYLIILAAACLASCTVYTPLQPTIPSVRGTGQAEVRANLQPATLRPEASMVYSPVNHLLLTGAGSWRPQITVPDTALFRTRQAEVGIGTYWPLGTQWMLSAIGGRGWGQTARRVNDGGIVLSYSTDFFARYKTYFGQFGLLYHRDERLTVAMGHRFTQVNFEKLRTSEYSLPIKGQLRLEPFGAVRLRLGNEQSIGHWQVEASGTISLAVPGRQGTKSPYDPLQARTDMNRGSAWLLGLGVIYGIAR